MANFKALWSNYSADGMCETTIHDSMRLWASAVESYFNSVSSRDQLNTILPHTSCPNLTSVNSETSKYHYGKNFHKYLLKASINKGEKGIMRFNESGVLDSVEFKIWNLNHKYEWKQVKNKK